MARWKYAVEQITIADRWTVKGQAAEIAQLQDRLNAKGSEGWELVSYEAIPMYGAFSSKLKGYAYIAFFKAPDVD